MGWQLHAWFPQASWLERPTSEKGTRPYPMPLPKQFITRLVAVSLFALAACESAGPTAGELEATLMSPNGPEGAAVFEIAALGLGPITMHGGRVFTSETGEVTLVVIILDAPGQLAFRIAVDDVDAPPGVTVLEVADGDNNLQPSLSGYGVVISQ